MQTIPRQAYEREASIDIRIDMLLLLTAFGTEENKPKRVFDPDG